MLKSTQEDRVLALRSHELEERKAIRQKETIPRRMFHTGVGVYPHFPNKEREKKRGERKRQGNMWLLLRGNIFGDYSLKFRVTPFFSSPHCLSPRSQTLPLARLSPRYSLPPFCESVSSRIRARSRKEAEKLGRMATTRSLSRKINAVLATNYVYILLLQLEIVNYYLVPRANN